MPYSVVEGGGEKKSRQAHRGSRQRTGCPNNIKCFTVMETMEARLSIVIPEGGQRYPQVLGKQ